MRSRRLFDIPMEDDGHATSKLKDRCCSLQEGSTNKANMMKRGWNE